MSKRVQRLYYLTDYKGDVSINKVCKHLIVAVILCMLTVGIFSVPAFANSAEPPSLVILVNNPPDDLSIVMISNEHQPRAKARRVAWEGYYIFYALDMQTDSEYTFRVTSNGESFECTLNEPLKRYNNVVTLNLSNQKLTVGEYPFRSVLLVSIRLVLTLVLEGIIFWFFGFRKKYSWLVFLIFNIITQGVLNIWLSSSASLMPAYLIITLIVGEFFVFTAEMIGFSTLLDEHKKTVIFIYTFVANFISLIAGGYLISVLPV